MTASTQVLTLTTLLALTFTSSAVADHKKDRDKPAVAARAPAVVAELKGKLLMYHYDLARAFDKNLWRVLEDNGYSEIIVEVRVRDGQDKIQHTQFHTLKIELLASGKVRVMTTQRKGRIYKDRAEMLKDLAHVRGKPIQAKHFSGDEGHLELIVLVNPVKVYAFPDQDAPVADKRVVPKTYYDRKMELRTRPRVVH